MASQPANKTASTLAPQLDPYKWKPGQSGNPKGRKPGAKQRLGESFVGDLLEHWEANGMDAIERVFEDDPGHYLSVMARVIPSEIIHTARNYDDLSDSELDALILDTARRIVADAGGEGQKALPAPLPDGPALATGERSEPEGLR